MASIVTIQPSSASVANNSGMAHGAVQALSEQGLAGKTFVAGADADLSAIKDIVAGRQQFEVLKDVSALAMTAARVAASLAKGEIPKEAKTREISGVRVSVVTTPVYAVTRENLDRVVFASGFHSRESVFGKSARR